MTTNVLILAAGQVPFDTHDGGFPLCLTEVDGVSLIERIVMSTRSIADAHYSFAISMEDAEHFHLDGIVRLLVPDSTVIRVPKGTKGSACTALLVACQLVKEHDLLVISANELLDMDLSEVVDQFKRRKLDGGTLTFRSVHPRYSYVRLNSEELVVEAAQQNPISQHATAGVFWFRETSSFVDSAKSIIRKGSSVSGKFFVAPCFNELILNQKKVGVIEIGAGKYIPLKTERQLYQFENGNNYEPH